MFNAERYINEIAKLRKEIPQYAGFSLIASGLVFLLGQGALYLIGPDSATPQGKTLELMFNIGIPLYIWHEFYVRAENRMSELKQKIRDFKNSTGLPNPITYTRFEKFINAVMILHDRSSLPN